MPFLDFITRKFRGKLPAQNTAEKSVAVAGPADRAKVATGDHARIDSPSTHIHVGDADSAAEFVKRVQSPHPHQLPGDLLDFEGREEQVDRLVDLLSGTGGSAAVVTAIGGMGGLGKTALAVRVGHLVAQHYPDGQILIRLNGARGDPVAPADAMGTVIRAFKPMAQLPDDVEALTSIYNDTLQGKRVLLILDDAADDAQIAPLRAPGSCGVIVTSRQKVAPVGFVSVDLDLMTDAEAVRLLRSIVKDRGSEAELARIAELCGCLPLALRVGGTFLAVNRGWSVMEYIDALADEGQRLARLVQEGVEDHDVPSSLSLSVRQLGTEHPELVDQWRLLSVFPSSFDRAATAAIWEVEDAIARDGLQALLNRSLVLHDEATQRFSLHDLMRVLAVDPSLLGDESAYGRLETHLAAASRSHSAHYLTILSRADDLYLQGGDGVLAGLQLFDLEQANILAGQTWASANAATDNSIAELCMRYPNAGAYIINLRLHSREQITWLKAAVAAAREIGDRRGEGTALGNLGIAYAELGETRRAIEFYEQRIEIAREIGDRYGEGAALGNLGNAHANLGETRRAIKFYEQQLVIIREIGDRRNEGNALGNLGLAHAVLGETRRAIEFYEQQLVITREIGDRRGEGNALGNLGIAYKNLGETRRAIEFYEQQLVITREIGDRRGEGAALGNLGNAYAVLGETRHAIEFYEQRIEIAHEIGDRRGEGIALGNLGSAYAALGEIETAGSSYTQALTILEEIEDPNAGQVRQWIDKLGD